MTVDVRFIEYMPFDGNKWNDKKMMSYRDMINAIKNVYPDFRRCEKEDRANDTSKAWRVPGFKGKVTDQEFLRGHCHSNRT